MTTLAETDRQLVLSRFMSDYSSQRTSIPILKGELRSIVDSLDNAMNMLTTYSTASVAQPQPPLRDMLLRLAADASEVSAVNAVYPTVSNRTVITFNESIITAVASSFIAGSPLSVSQIFVEDIGRELVRRRSELGI